jgi:hypothetical protein
MATPIEASEGPSRAVLELAENLNAATPLAPGDRRFELEEAVIWLGAGGAHPAFTVVQRLRFASDPSARVAAIRELLRAHGRREATWEIGPSAEPRDLLSRLLALGMTPFEEPVATAMILRRSLPPSSSEVVVRRADSVEDAILVSELLNAVFGERRETPDERRARITTTFDAYRASGRAAFLATVERRPVAAAHAIYTDCAVVLCGGATLPEARGLGAYRALVAARHDEAVRRGTPTLVVQAGAMSRPILEGLGFETVGTVNVLRDRL